jgi:hypothetical protein
MMAILRDRLTPRKQVLLVCAYAGVQTALQDPHYAVAERFVDGKATAADLQSSWVALEREAEGDPYFWDLCHNTHADEVFRRKDLLEIARGEENLLDLKMGDVPCHPLDPRSLAGDLMREVFGNPWRPFAVHPASAWLAWNDGAVLHLAQRIYDERTFKLLPRLADMLQEAGCKERDVLEHCRSAGPHFRGCWVIDRLLGKY